METGLRRRLVGAIVIAAVAVIFIPLIFDGTEEERLAVIEEIPPAPTFDFREQIAVNDIQAAMEFRRRANATAAGACFDRDETESQSKLLDQNGLPMGWSLQVASFRERDNAVALRSEIRELGHGAYVLLNRTNEGQFYQVLVGPSLDREGLSRAGQEIADKMGLTVQIVRYRVEDDARQIGG